MKTAHDVRFKILAEQLGCTDFQRNEGGTSELKVAEGPQVFGAKVQKQIAWAN